MHIMSQVYSRFNHGTLVAVLSGLVVLVSRGGGIQGRGWGWGEGRGAARVFPETGASVVGGSVQTSGSCRQILVCPALGSSRGRVLSPCCRQRLLRTAVEVVTCGTRLLLQGWCHNHLRTVHIHICRYRWLCCVLRLPSRDNLPGLPTAIVLCNLPLDSPLIKVGNGVHHFGNCT